MQFKKRISFLIFLILIFCNSNVFAKWTAKTTISKYMPAYGTNVYVKATSPHVNPAGCNSTYYYLMTKNNQADFDEYKKIILTAAASGKKVTFGIHDTVCEGNYPRITRLIFEGG